LDCVPHYAQRVMERVAPNLSFGDFLVRLNTWATNRLIIIAGERNDEKCKDFDFDHGATGNVLIRLLSKQSIGTALFPTGDCHGR
jgi:hypothetical protein